MLGEWLFFDGGRLRPFWRFFLSAGLIILAQYSVGIFLGVAAGLFAGSRQHVLFWSNVILFLMLLAVFKILTGFFEGKPLASIGIALRGAWKRDLGLGLILGATMMLATGGLEWVLGLAVFSRNAVSPRLLLESGVFYGVLFAVAACNEEFIFRGYPFQRLIDSVGPGGAVATMSIFFGIVHLENPSHTWLSTANTILIGALLAVGYLRTRALWLPIGLHFGWNFFQGYVLGLDVSGLKFSKSLLQASVNGSRWLTGGNYGPEGSCLTTGVAVLATIYLMLSTSIHLSGAKSALALDSATTRGENSNPVARIFR